MSQSTTWWYVAMRLQREDGYFYWAFSEPMAHVKAAALSDEWTREGHVVRVTSDLEKFKVEHRDGVL